MTLAIIFAATLLVCLITARVLWKEHRQKQRRQVEEIRRRAHLKMVQFNDARIERTLLMNRSDLF